MTIKDFSKLCKCTTQTLRYYDHINLLKPARVDGMTYSADNENHLYILKRV